MQREKKELEPKRMKNILEKLNTAQREAVVNYKGPSLVIAGAGSGKTRVLTFRIAYLLSQGVRPSNILALTFTNKAAREMKERISSIVGVDTAKYLAMGTFHSIFSRILRTEADAIKYPKNFTIYDTQDAQNLIKSIIKELHLSDELYKVSAVYSRISKAKNNLLTSQAYSINSQLLMNDAKSKMPEFHKIYELYSRRCFMAGAMDFDDLLLLTNVLFRDNPEILERYQKQYQYILVDEYQDTNFSQYLIIKKLSETHKNLCVVGDDAQSIYSFRGAKIENILNFQRDYAQAKTFKLEQNYRSTQTIVNAANSLIKKNTHQIPKNTFSENQEGSKIEVIRTITDKEEGLRIAGRIMEFRMNEHYQFSNFAILYRTNAQSRIFEEALRKANIPYKIYGGLSFYQRKEIKDVLSYCRLIVNQRDNEAFKRIINYPKRGIGNTSLDKLEEVAHSNGISLWDSIFFIKENDKTIPKAAMSKFYAFAELITRMKAFASQNDAFSTMRFISKESTILQELHSEKTPEGISRYENLQELINSIKAFTEEKVKNGETALLEDFLSDVALITDQDTEKQQDLDRVVLMTIHSAKGLEFKTVFIVGVEEDLFPSFMSASSVQDLEEERRLFYVALTRAEKHLCISFTENRYRWGQPVLCKPSRFLSEINAEYIELTEPDYYPDSFSETYNDYSFSKPKIQEKTFSFQKKETQNPVSFPQKTISSPKNQFFSKNNEAKPSNDDEFVSNTGLSVGNVVEHVRFGKGIVTQIEGKEPNVKASIDFAAFGVKHLLLKFAKLKILKN